MKTYICSRCGYVGTKQHRHFVPGTGHREGRNSLDMCPAFASIQVEKGFSFRKQGNS